ncbi:putative isopenicillin N epimerase [Rosellinia necatrix]|uniref:Putative isopenicillin N epimerase n=1 Tax=Rosellinia necatrix TaxID=77044 RepID=A0A1W2TCH5_ROSNE|nr:putative isopenicillin N epimerase [Rosellinia necatrix]
MNSACITSSSWPKALDKCAPNQDESIMDATTAMVESFGDWQIRSDIVYLDNGAFGACPTLVVEKQQHIRRWIEENPHEFFERNYVSSWEASRKSLANFLHADAADLVFTPGATHGMNVVIQSIRFESGDEIVTTNHAYSSVRLVLDHVAKRDGARIIVVDIPLEVSGQDALLQRILASVTPRTRFAVIDHVPSRSGLIFPMKEIVSELASLNIDTLVDGAHAPGMIPLDITDINAAYYVANCHKWMCVPRGVGFLHVRRDRAQSIKPLVIARSPFVVNKSNHSHLEHSFGWMGTYCPSAVLTLPTSLSYLGAVMPGGYNSLISRNHDLTVLARRIICRTLGIPLPCPDNMIGAMATVPLPDSPGPEQEGMLPIQQTLWREHGIVIPIYSWPAYPKRVMRLSVQAYNSLDQYLRLANCLRSVLHSEKISAQETLNSWPLKSLKQSDIWGNSNGHASTEYASVCGHHNANGNSDSDSLDTPHQDIENPTPWTLVELAQSRIRRIIRGSFDSCPVSLYPTAGDLEMQFLTEGNGELHHANLELSRITYMLSCLDRRRIPKLMAPVVASLLEAEDVIDNWVDSVDCLRNQARILARTITFDMKAPQTPDSFPVDIGDFIQKVAPYEPESQEDNISLKFWLRALADFTSKGPWSLARVTSFLQIHSFLKDPVGGLRCDIATRIEVFGLLFSKLKAEFESEKHSKAVWEEVVAQLALESSFLSQPYIRNASYVHFVDDQQLVYSYVDMDQLARSEFACMDIVIGMVQDIIGGSSGNECSIAPITIASSYPICSSHDARPVIIDGNNRTATIAFLRFVSIYGVVDDGETEELRNYCRDYGLGPVCFVDLRRVLQTLWESHTDVIDQLRKSEKLAQFKGVRQLPALVTEESSFFTKTLVDGDENILQPVHQSIFATDDLLVALPGKMQSHGRAKGFVAMPIR